MNTITSYLDSENTERGGKNQHSILQRNLPICIRETSQQSSVKNQCENRKMCFLHRTTAPEISDAFSYASACETKHILQNRNRISEECKRETNPVQDQYLRGRQNWPCTPKLKTINPQNSQNHNRKYKTNIQLSSTLHSLPILSKYSLT